MILDPLIPLLPEWLGVVAILMFARLSPRFRRPPLIFKYARRDGMVALSLYALILAIAFIFTFVNISAFQALFSEPLRNLSYSMLLAAISVVPFITAIIVRKQPWRSMGWNRAMAMPGLQFGLALAFLSIFLRGKFNTLVDGLATNEITALLLWLVLALAEETIFRGYLQLRFTTWWGQLPAWLGTAGLFLLWQLPRWIAQPDQLFFNLVVGAVQALFCGWMMRQSGSIIPSALFRAVSGWLSFVN